MQGIVPYEKGVNQSIFHGAGCAAWLTFTESGSLSNFIENAREEARLNDLQALVGRVGANPIATTMTLNDKSKSYTILLHSASALHPDVSLCSDQNWQHLNTAIRSDHSAMFKNRELLVNFLRGGNFEEKRRITWELS